MAIISTIGRRSFKVRALIFIIYAGLGLGALTMVYPFLLMVAGTTKSAVDNPDLRIVPKYLTDTSALYRKYTEALFNESFETMKVTYFLDTASFQSVEPPVAVNERLVAAWEDFCNTTDLPFYSYTVGEMQTVSSRGVLPRHLREFKSDMARRFNGNLARFNVEMEAEFITWNVFYYAAENFVLRRNKPNLRPLDLAFREFKANKPVAQRLYFTIEGYYRTIFLQSKYGKDIAAYNQAHGTQYRTWNEIHYDRQYPTGPERTDQERDDWDFFTRNILNLYWVRAEPEAAAPYREFLNAKYSNIESLNRNYGTKYTGFAEVPLIQEPPTSGLAASDWDTFAEGWKDPDTGALHQLPIDAIRIHCVDFMFRDYLEARFQTVAAANAALGTEHASFLDVLPPQHETHYRDFLARTGELRREFTFRNFITVFDYVVLHGRAIVNTVIYCALSILAALIVNPLAAYALSRYKPPSQYKVLLFLMLTMSFPPMVTQIPVFLMLREFRLLNTFWALILPGLANGYSIFLLKGFFDSLPQDLYESASLDGAGEFRIFWQITMSLSTPILAVIALGAFTHAYSNFMMALLICQDENMWTLMPWLYQLQQRSCEGIVFASLLVASVPTFIVFVLCQNVIMRGIVVPVEK